MPARPCRFCRTPLEPVQEFRFLVETATLDDPVHLARIRALPAAAGRPLAVCKPCQTALAARPPAAPRGSGLLAAAGLVSVGLFLAAVFDV